MEIKENVGYCGLICALCHEKDICKGCKSDHNCCGRHMREEGCFQYNCCVEKGIKGCWECEVGPCDKDMFCKAHDIRNRVFVSVAKEEGIDQLLAYVFENQKRGIQYGYQKDYDNLDSAEAVIAKLHKYVKTSS